jgi:hypothetical protein
MVSKVNSELGQARRPKPQRRKKNKKNILGSSNVTIDISETLPSSIIRVKP